MVLLLELTTKIGLLAVIATLCLICLSFLFTRLLRLHSNDSKGYQYEKKLRPISSSRKRAAVPSLATATSEQLLNGLSQGIYTSVDLVNAYLARINEINPKLRVVMEFNPDAWNIAAKLDYERKHGKTRGPLHGLPVLIKGNIGTLDRMQTNAGSFALQDSIVSSDSTVVTRLRYQGLIVLGKASLTEWSMFRANNWPHAWNPIFGQTYAAYYPKQCPQGSSSGSAVAADLGLTWAAIGTETDGSIIKPCERSNIVGIKPTVGLTSRHLIVPVSEHQDTIGPMARTVKDAAALLQIIAGSDLNDPYTLASPFQSTLPDYVAACKPNGLRGKRIGIARNVMTYTTEPIAYTLEAFEAAIKTMAHHGATIVENIDFPAFTTWQRTRAFNPVTRGDFATNLPQYLSQLRQNPQKITVIASLRAFTQSHPLENYPDYNTKTWDTILDPTDPTPSSNTSTTFRHELSKNTQMGGQGGILGALETHNLDAIVLPSRIAASIPALVGSPVITVPLGFMGAGTEVTMCRGGDEVDLAPGVPFGISFLGRLWGEETLIEIAFGFESVWEKGEGRRVVEPKVDLRDVLGGREL